MVMIPYAVFITVSNTYRYKPLSKKSNKYIYTLERYGNKPTLSYVPSQLWTAGSCPHVDVPACSTQINSLNFGLWSFISSPAVL